MNAAAGAPPLTSCAAPALRLFVLAGAYAGLDRAECRKRLWVRAHRIRCALFGLTWCAQADMQAAGLAIKEEPHTLRVPRSQRGGEARA